ncbi:MAG: hypothetical protein ACFE0I_21610 [Elainellaceae cyanobacterium]
MNNLEMRDRIQLYIEQLSPERLPVALDFLAYLVERESDEATEELLAIPNLRADLEKAEQEVQSGELTDWRSI